jgi:hypothetical protein
LRVGRRTNSQLRARFDELEHALDLDAEADPAARRLVSPSGQAVTLAVRRLVHAKGCGNTRQALLELAAACRGWAPLLAIPDERAE